MLENTYIMIQKEAGKLNLESFANKRSNHPQEYKFWLKESNLIFFCIQGLLKAQRCVLGWLDVGILWSCMMEEIGEPRRKPSIMDWHDN